MHAILQMRIEDHLALIAKQIDDFLETCRLRKPNFGLGGLWLERCEQLF